MYKYPVDYTCFVTIENTMSYEDHYNSIFIGNLKLSPLQIVDVCIFINVIWS